MLPLITSLLLGTDAVALIVTNNKSLELGRPELRYADDDGVQYAELFEERLSHDRVFLLAELDRDSARLYPAVAARALPPSRDSLFGTVRQAAKVLSEARAAGRPTDAFVVFAGHGDTDKGAGFIELSDGRLSAEELEAILEELAPPRDANAVAHVILDSCNSYFMLNPRKPGGLRFAAASQVGTTFFERHPNIGAIISTSAEAETYEWSELQSGIFSYVLRSGLRGAADANGDGRLSYLELEAFSAQATGGIVNEKFRPRIYARAPKAEKQRAFWQLPSDNTLARIRKTAGSARRITVRDHQGVRLLDMHAHPQSTFDVVLPRSSEPFEVEERGARVVYHQLAQGTTLVLGESPGVVRENPLAARGDSRVFQGLFSDPFGVESVEKYDAEPRPEAENTLGIGDREAERFRLTLQTFADTSMADKKRAAYISLGISGAMFTAAGIGLAFSLTGPAENRIFGAMTSAGVAAAAIAPLVVGAVQANRDTVEQKLYTELIANSAGGPEARARATVEAEAALYKFVLRKRDARKRQAVGVIVGGALTFAGSALMVGVGSAGFFGAGVSSMYSYLGIAGAAAGAAMLVTGILQLTLLRTPQERMWDLYQANGGLTESSEKHVQLKIRDLHVEPLLAPTQGGGMSVGLSGGFRF